MKWKPENVSRRDFGGMSEYVAGPGKQFLAEHLDLEKPQTLVDMGVWTGRNLPLLIKMAGEDGIVYGYDHPNARPAMLKAQENYPTVYFCEGTLTPLPFKDGLLSGGICWRVLHNLNKGNGYHEIAYATSELRRVLKPKAPLLIAVRAATYLETCSPIAWQTENPTGVKRWDICFNQSACLSFFPNLGFDVLHIEPIVEKGLSDGCEYENNYLAVHLIRK